MRSYHHPPTFIGTGDIAADFASAFEGYEDNTARFLPESADAAILDLGCGWGQLLSWLKSRGYTRVIGIDIDAPQIEHCLSLGLQAVRVDDSAGYLDSHANELDLIFAYHVLEHLPVNEAIELLKACLRALRVGGRIIVATPNMSAMSAGFTRHIELSHVTGFTEHSLQQALGLAGFKEISVAGERHRWKLTWNRLIWRFAQTWIRLIWRTMLMCDLGTDAPKIVCKNLYAVGRRVT